MGLKKNYIKSKNICMVTFTLSKSDIPGAQSVAVLGDFNGWDRRNGIELKKEKKNYSATIELEAGRDYEYRYILNGQHWYNDPEPDAYSPSPYMGSLNCVVKLDKVEVKKKSGKSDKKTAVSTKKSSAKKSSAKKSASKKETVKKSKSGSKSSAASVTRAKTPRTGLKKTTIARASTTKSKSTTKRSLPPKHTAKPSTKDNLKRIEGIGPKIESMLNAKNIKTFDQLASANVTVLQVMLNEAGSRFSKYKPANWIKAAKVAAKK